MKYLLLFLTFIILFSSCTENQRVKNFGSKGVIKLPPSQKLVSVTWKESHIWYLTKPMTPNDVPEQYQFREESSWGVIEGTYTIIETR